MRQVALAIVVLLTFASVCEATKKTESVQGDVFSPNGKFVLHIDRQGGKHDVFDVRNRKTPLWSFKAYFLYEIAFVSDDGAAVVATSWQKKSYGFCPDRCIGFWNKAGTKIYSIEEIAPYPAYDYPIVSWVVAFIDDSSPMRWYDEIELTDSTFRVRTTDLYEYTFSLSDGEIVEKRFVWTNLFYKPWLYLVVIVIAIISFVFARRAIREDLLPAAPLPASKPAPVTDIKEGLP